jgi:hypothetical protein
MTLFVIVGILALLHAVCLAFLYYRLVLASRSFQIDPEWWKSFTPHRYSPIARLLDESDFDYLREQQGCNSEIIRELRRRRISVFEGLLREMTADFGRLQAMGQLMLSAGVADASLREALFQQKVQFTIGLVRVRMQLVGYRMGIGRVDVRRMLEAMRLSATMLRPDSMAPSASF